jgi:hypothetical protein
MGLSTVADYPDSDVAGLVPRLAVATGVHTNGLDKHCLKCVPSGPP